ncbi:MAG: hypothetical protein J6Q13_04190 [Clostridia bacterium]|nr:hypothetical protein [Clostridia bacterium]
MKKFFSFMLAFCMIIPCLFMLSACSHEHTFAETWSFNDTHHWHASTCEHSEEKKDYAEHVGTEDGICDVCYYGAQALIGETAYTSLVDAIEDAEVGSTVVVFDDVVINEEISITKKITLNLNGKTISNTGEIWNDVADPNLDRAGLICVRAGGDLTITGEGTIDALENDCHAVWLNAENAKLTIENGTFIGNISAIYVRQGQLQINGGRYDIKQLSTYGDYRYLLNCLDENYLNSTAQISVSGGVFNNFNPANNLAEGANTNFVPTGYDFIENNNIYTIVAE